MAVLGSNDTIDITPGADLRFPVYRYAGTQVLTLTGGATGGTFTLTYRSVTTSALAYNASAATVQAALEALSTIKAHNVAVSGSGGGPWTVTPQGQLKVADFLVNLITGTISGLMGGSNYALTPTVPLRDVSALDYNLQARTVAGSTNAKIWINSDADPNPGPAGAQGAIEMADAAAGIIWVHVEDAATAALDFSDGNPPGVAHWVLMETDGTLENALQEDGTFRLRSKWFVP